MRDLKFIFLLSVFVFSFSCGKDEFVTNDMEIKNDNERTSRYHKNKEWPNTLYKPKHVNNKLIIQYKDGVHDSLKIKFRNSHNISNRQFEQFEILGSYNVCDLCPNKSIELWTYNRGDIDIEHKLGSIQSGGGDSEGIVKDVDFEFSISLEKDDNSVTGLNTHFNYLPKLVSPTNPGVTIAVLDSGVNPYFFNTPFLYNAEYDAIGAEKSGWDFVNNDPDAFDDNASLHGTIVTKIITQKLEALNIPHQIIPIKICDETGRASYFNMICGVNYALSRAAILQMSVGWYEDITSAINYSSIFPKLIKEKKGKALLVTSAGNNGIDVDQVQLHFPSGYSLFSNNVISVTSVNQAGSNISYFSNYGLETVHFYARGEDIPFDDLSGAVEPYKVSGTSFAAPLVAAKAAEIYYWENLPPNQIIYSLKESGTDILDSFDSGKLIKFPKIIE